MKTGKLLCAMSIALLSLSLSACSDDDDTPKASVPEVCTQAFQAKYPTVKTEKWENKGKYYTAEWSEAAGNSELEAWFLPTGQVADSWVMTVTDYGEDLFMVPADLSIALNKTEYATANVTDIELIEYPDATKNIYTMEVTPANNSSDLLLIFTASDYTFVKAIPEPQGDITPDTVL